MERVALTLNSGNSKTGPMAVSTSTADYCPTSCALKDNGCYAENSHQGMHWRKVTSGERGVVWSQFLAEVRTLPAGKFAIWRHNVAGDLPTTEAGLIDKRKVRGLIAANAGRGGFTYTHHDPEANRHIIQAANLRGFTVNLSADNAAQADEYAALGSAPVVTLLATEAKTSKTPGGRTVVRCPAETSKTINCQTCRLCQRNSRKFIIGFYPHGSGKKQAAKVAAKHSTEEG